MKSKEIFSTVLSRVKIWQMKSIFLTIGWRVGLKR